MCYPKIRLFPSQEGWIEIRMGMSRTPASVCFSVGFALSRFSPRKRGGLKYAVKQEVKQVCLCFSPRKRGGLKFIVGDVEGVAAGFSPRKRGGLK